MRIDRLAVAVAALFASGLLISCADVASKPSSNTTDKPTVEVGSVLVEDTTPVVGSEPVGQPLNP